MGPTFNDFGGVLQTGFALNLGLSAFESIGNIFSLRFDRRIEGLAKCEFRVHGERERHDAFNSHLASARTRLQQAEEAVSNSSLKTVPFLILSAAICAIFLICGAWHPADVIANSVGHICVIISFAPGVIALGINLYIWNQHSEGIEKSIAAIFDLIRPA